MQEKAASLAQGRPCKQKSLRRIYRHPNYAFTLTDIDELDLCDSNAVANFVRRGRYAYIINCAAYTAVDRAESDAERCLQINRDAVGHLATAAR
ncbi:sugar nucleotide-binding protein, partial [uncultured Campylobacter sp.]|uniref:sugar nucleotide-binding protein n=1 Tax=uncultured Campylobacter sp. TaxID=218934 RepID=UPI00262DF8F3